MAEPRIEWQGPKLIFRDDAGGEWRVYDCVLADYRSRAVPLGDPRGVHREFVNRDGTRRIARFAKGTSRAISPAVLAAQLRDAEDVERERTDPRSGAAERRA